MSNEVEQDQVLRTRFAITTIATGVLIIANGVWGMASIYHRDAEEEVLAKQNAEIDARIDEAKAVLAEVEQVRKQTGDVNARAAKIEAALSEPNAKGKWGDMNAGRLRLAYRAIQVALIVTLVLLVFRWRDHRRDVEYAEQSSSKKKELLDSAEQVLGQARQQLDVSKRELEAAQSRLTAAETRQAAANEQK
jgi:hypothetical protein